MLHPATFRPVDHLRVYISVAGLAVLTACGSMEANEPPIEGDETSQLEEQEMTGLPVESSDEYSSKCSVTGECKPIISRTAFGREIARAVFTAPRVSESISEIEAARANLRIAKSSRLPYFTIDAESDDVNLSIRQPIWAAGRIKAEIKVAEAALEEEVFNFLATLNEASFEVIDAYTRLISSSKSVNAIEMTLADHVDLNEMIERRNKAGLSAGGDSDLMSARISLLQADLSSAQSVQKLAELELERLIGSTVDLAIADEVFTEAQRSTLLGEEKATRLIATSPSIQASKSGIERAKAAIDVAKATRFPVLSLVGQQQLSALASDNRVSDNRVFIGFNANFGPGAGHKDRIESASYNLEKATALSARRFLQSQKETEALQVQLASSIERIGIYETVVQSNKELLESYRSQMTQSGRRSWVDIAGVLRDIGDARQAIANSEAELFSAQVKLTVMLLGLSEL